MSQSDRPVATEPTHPMLADQLRALDLALLRLERLRMSGDQNLELILGLQPLVRYGFVDFDCLPDRVRFLFQSWVSVIVEIHKGKPADDIRKALKSAFFTAYFVSRLYEYGDLPPQSGDSTHADGDPRPDPAVAPPDDDRTDGGFV